MAVQWNAAIDPMYSGGPKKHCNMRHIAAIFAPAAKKTTAIACFSCNDKHLYKKLEYQKMRLNPSYNLSKKENNIHK